eukprot:scaffold196136_cov42-Prasinocladus_malaysianus.AAC.1
MSSGKRQVGVVENGEVGNLLDCLLPGGQQRSGEDGGGRARPSEALVDRTEHSLLNVLHEIHPAHPQR